MYLIEGGEKFRRAVKVRHLQNDLTRSLRMRMHSRVIIHFWFKSIGILRWFTFTPKTQTGSLSLLEISAEITRKGR